MPGPEKKSDSILNKENQISTKVKTESKQTGKNPITTGSQKEQNLKPLKKEDKNFRWVFNGWSECSVSCGGKGKILFS